MKNFARLAVLAVATTITASAGNITLKTSAGQPDLNLQKLTLPKGAFTPAEFMPSAAARAYDYDYDKDGYIGTVRDIGTFSLDQSTPAPESAVPEPATFILVGSGLLAAARRLRKQ